MKSRVWGLALVLALCAGCGKEERREAVSLYKILAEKRVAFAEGIGTEGQFVAAVRSWCEAIVANGSGTGKDLEQNATVAGDLAKSADALSAQVGQVRQAVYNLTVTKEFTQGVRTTLITDLTRRQRFLQELKMNLDAAAKGFEALGQGKGYKGDSYPNAMTTVGPAAQRYSAPNDSVAAALKGLTEKYSIQESEATATAGS